MKVLVVTPIYPTPDDPQAGIFIHRQIANLAKCGVECRVLHVRPAPPRFPRWLRHPSWLRYRWKRRTWPRVLDGVPNDTVFYARKWTSRENVIPAMQDALTEWVQSHSEYQSADVVYGQFLWPGAAAALALRHRFGWPVVGILRGGELQEWYANNADCRQSVHHVLDVADLVLANCRALRDEADRLHPCCWSRISVVYNGCDAMVFRPAADREKTRQALGFHENDGVVILCGTIEARKGIDELAAAWNAFVAVHPDWQLVVIGKIVDRRLATTLRVAGRGRVRLTGQLPAAEVLRYLQAGDLYVQPSRLEGLANATMEAMAVGLPVISTNVWGQTELIADGESGWLVRPCDPNGLLAALEGAAADRERARRIGAAARAVIQTRFNPRTQALRLADLLARTATERRDSRPNRSENSVACAQNRRPTRACISPQ